MVAAQKGDSLAGSAAAFKKWKLGWGRGGIGHGGEFGAARSLRADGARRAHGCSNSHALRENAITPSQVRKKEPFVGGAGTYEGRHREAKPHVEKIIVNAAGPLNPTYGESLRFFYPGELLLL
jgi:hypothetical protein